MSETSKKDRVFYKGLGLYIFDQNYLFDRSSYIQGRIIEIEKKLAKSNPSKEYGFERKDLLSKQEIKSLENNYILQNNLIIDENLYLAANKNLHIQQGVKIFFK